MTEFKKLKIKQFPQIQERETNEVKFWRSYNVSKMDKHFSAPSCISFDPSGTGFYLVTASTKVSLYDPLTDNVQRTFSRFQDDVYSAKYRQDGKLFITGDKTGHVKIIDVYNKSILRQLSQHTAAVRSVNWCSDSVHMLSGSDDKSIKYWDLGTGEVLWENKHYHTDYIRSVDTSPMDSNLLLSGSYDHSVCLWDVRIKSSAPPVQVYNIHNHPITTCMFTPTGSLILAANGNQIKVWDMLKGGMTGDSNNSSSSNNSTNTSMNQDSPSNSCLHTFENHTKNITSLAMDGTNSRLLSSGLDGHIKIYNLSLLQYIYGLKCISPLMSVNISKDNKKLIVGHVDGNLEIKNKKLNSSYNPIGIPNNSTTLANTIKEIKLTNSLSTNRASNINNINAIINDNSTNDDMNYENPLETIQYQAQLQHYTELNNHNHHNNYSSSMSNNDRFYKGAGLSTDIITDYTIETERAVKLKSYEKFLKKFQYAQSLDHALQSRNPLIVMTLFEELSRRNGLVIALSSRDEISLEPILSFLIRYINNPRYSKLLIQVTHVLLDIYSQILGYSESVDELFIKLKKHVYTEILLQKQLIKCISMLDGIINASLA